MPNLCMHDSQVAAGHYAREVMEDKYEFSVSCVTESFSAVKRSASSDSAKAIGLKGRTILCLTIMQPLLLPFCRRHDGPCHE